MPIAKPAPPRPRTPESSISSQHVARLHRQRLAQHLVAAAPRVDVERVEPGLVDVLEEDLRSGLPPVLRRRPCARLSCLSGSTSRPALTSSTIRSQSSSSSGPTYSPSTDAIGAMSHAPRHSNVVHVEVRVVAGGAQHRVVDLVGAEQRARDVRAHVDVVAALRRRSEHVVERRHRGQVRGRQPHHAGGLLDRRRRAASRARAGRSSAPGSRPSGCPGTSPSAPRSPTRTCAGTGVVAGSGTTAGSFVEVDRLVPARDARAVRVAA